MVPFFVGHRVGSFTLECLDVVHCGAAFHIRMNELTL